MQASKQPLKYTSVQERQEYDMLEESSKHIAAMINDKMERIDTFNHFHGIQEELSVGFSLAST